MASASSASAVPPPGGRAFETLLATPYAWALGTGVRTAGESFLKTDAGYRPAQRTFADLDALALGLRSLLCFRPYNNKELMELAGAATLRTAAATEIRTATAREAARAPWLDLTPGRDSVSARGAGVRVVRCVPRRRGRGRLQNREPAGQ
jgi:hypothetical protein